CGSTRRLLLFRRAYGWRWRSVNLCTSASSMPQSRVARPRRRVHHHVGVSTGFDAGCACGQSVWRREAVVPRKPSDCAVRRLRYPCGLCRITQRADEITMFLHDAAVACRAALRTLPIAALLWSAGHAGADEVVISDPTEGSVAPYVPTVEEDVELMLDVAGVGPGDYVIDLGAGDG